eukprot:740614-Prymnesium_polylepis.1
MLNPVLLSSAARNASSSVGSAAWSGLAARGSYRNSGQPVLSQETSTALRRVKIRSAACAASLESSFMVAKTAKCGALAATCAATCAGLVVASASSHRKSIRSRSAGVQRARAATASACRSGTNSCPHAQTPASAVNATNLPVPLPISSTSCDRDATRQHQSRCGHRTQMRRPQRVQRPHAVRRGARAHLVRTTHACRYGQQCSQELAEADNLSVKPLLSPSRRVCFLQLGAHFPR